MDTEVHNDHPVAGEIEEDDDEEPQPGEPGGVAVEPAGGPNRRRLWQPLMLKSMKWRMKSNWS